MRNATERRLLALSHDGPVRGEDHPSSKLSEEDVIEIVEAVRQILRGNSWSWLTGIEPLSKRGG